MPGRLETTTQTLWTVAGRSLTGGEKLTYNEGYHAPRETCRGGAQHYRDDILAEAYWDAVM